LHNIKSIKPGLLINREKETTWKDIILSIFNGEDFDWEEVSTRKGVNKELILFSVERIIDLVQSTDLDLENYSMLHTDFNQRNLFVDPRKNEIAGIIDWEEAMFGDPLYDFARVRMYLWHFNLDDSVVSEYYKMQNYTQLQKQKEDLYWLSRVIQYLAWYSEELNEFNLARIDLHQNFLKEYNWGK